MRSGSGPGRRGQLLLGLAIAWMLGMLAPRALAAPDPERGARVFGVCSACHSLHPDLNMTGPSLAAVWGRKAGGLKSFTRYSPALKDSGVVWDARNLDAWLTNPAVFIPGNRMPFRGIPDERDRADLIAFLHAANDPASAGQKVEVPAAYTSLPLNLKQLPPARQVKAIRACGDAYYVETGDNQTLVFWDRNLRFHTDASQFGPAAGTPAILPTGMIGDRALVVFARPGDISAFIQSRCQAASLRVKPTPAEGK